LSEVKPMEGQTEVRKLVSERRAVSYRLLSKLPGETVRELKVFFKEADYIDFVPHFQFVPRESMKATDFRG